MGPFNAGWTPNPYAFSAPPIGGGLQGDIFTGSAPPGSTPGGAGGMFGQLASMLGPTVVSQIGGSRYVPGPFSSSRNLFDFSEQQRWRQFQMEAGSLGAQADRERVERLVRGVYNTTGMDWQRDRGGEAVNQVMGLYSAGAPFLAATMPRFVEAVGGSEGSALVAAQQQLAAGRYLVDPATGLSYQSGKTAGAITGAVAAELYGTAQGRFETRGISQGRLTEFLAAGVLRGDGPGSVRGRLGEATVSNLLAGGTLSNDDIARAGLEEGDVSNILAATRDDGRSREEREAALGEALTSVDTSRSVGWVRERTEMIRSLEDVFGPNGAVPELLGQLDRLTQHNVERMSAADQARMVREVKALADMSGTTIEGMNALGALAAERIKANGGPREAIADARALAAAGKAAYTNFGLGRYLNVEQLAAEDAILAAEDATSAAANQLGVIARISGSGADIEGTEAEAILQAAQAGRSTYEFEGQTRSIYTDDADELRRRMRGTGVSDEQLAEMTEQTRSNLSEAAKSDVLGGVRDLGETRDFRIDAVRALENAGARDAEGLLDAVEGMRFEDRGDKSKVIAAIMQSQGVDEVEAENLRGALNDGTDGRWLAVMGRQDSAEARRAVKLRAKAEAVLAGTLSGFGGGADVTKRFVDFLMQAGEEGGDASFTGLMSQMLGGVESEDVRKVLDPIQGELGRLMEEARAGAAAGTPEGDAAFNSALSSIQSLVGPQEALLDESHALAGAFGVTPEQLMAGQAGTGALSAEGRQSAAEALKSALSESGLNREQLAGAIGLTPEQMDGLAAMSPEQAIGAIMTMSDEQLRTAATEASRQAGGAAATLQAIRGKRGKVGADPEAPPEDEAAGDEQAPEGTAGGGSGPVVATIKEGTVLNIAGKIDLDGNIVAGKGTFGQSGATPTA